MYNKNQIKLLSSIDLLFLIALMKSTLLLYIKVVLSRLPYIGQISDQIITLFIIILIIICVPQFVKKLKPIDYIIYMVCFVVYISQYLFFPNNQLYLDEVITSFLLYSLPYYYIGRIIDYDKTSNYIVIISILSIISYTLIRYIFGSNNDIDTQNLSGYMGDAYRLLPFIILIILDAFKTHRKISIIFSIFSLILLMSLGNRGSLLYAMIFVTLCIIINVKNKSLIIVFILILCVLYSYIDSFMDVFYMYFEKMNASTRIFDMYNEEGINTSGRDEIYATLFNELNYKWSGLGLTGDRVITGSYSHNIFIELLFSFGYIGGSIIILLFLTLILKAYRKSIKTKDYMFYTALLSFGLLPLMTSMSFLTYNFFYLFLGYSVKLVKENPKYIIQTS